MGASASVCWGGGGVSGGGCLCVDGGGIVCVYVCLGVCECVCVCVCVPVCACVCVEGRGCTYGSNRDIYVCNSVLHCALMYKIEQY